MDNSHGIQNEYEKINAPISRELQSKANGNILKLAADILLHENETCSELFTILIQQQRPFKRPELQLLDTFFA